MTSLQSELTKILKLLNLAEKLKFELRHSWLSNGRQESVAEHSWRLALMVVLLAPHLGEPVDMEKSLKMALIHDLVEAEAGDVPVFECLDANVKQTKVLREQQAIQNIKELLDNSVGQELYDLWYEFEEKQSLESKFVTALDKLEVYIQHNEADLDTWLYKEKLMVFQPRWKEDHCEFNETLKLLCKMVKQACVTKLSDAGEDIEQLEAEATDAELPA